MFISLKATDGNTNNSWRRGAVCLARYGSRRKSGKPRPEISTCDQSPATVRSLLDRSQVSSSDLRSKVIQPPSTPYLPIRSLSPTAVDIDQSSDSDFDFVDSQEKNFLSLPGEVILHIFSLMDLISLGRCAQVCTLFREVMGIIGEWGCMPYIIIELTKDSNLLTGHEGPDAIHSGVSQAALPPSQLAMPPRPRRQGQVFGLPRPLLGRELRQDQVKHKNVLVNLGLTPTVCSPAALCVLLRSCSKSLVCVRLNNCHAVDSSVMEILST